MHLLLCLLSNQLEPNDQNVVIVFYILMRDSMYICVMCSTHAFDAWCFKTQAFHIKYYGSKFILSCLLFNFPRLSVVLLYINNTTESYAFIYKW